MPEKLCPSVSIGLARIVIRYASDIGMDADDLSDDLSDDLWRRCGLETLPEGDDRIPATLFDKVWQEVEAKSGEAVFGLRLGHGDKPSLGAVAKVLAMSPRRLQQKLQSEQTGYRELLDHVRKESALGLLLNPDTTISEITFILGFSDQSSVTHAFQSWTGMTPANYRKTVR